MAIRRIEKRRERNVKIFMGVFLAFLMVASGFGVYLSGKGSAANSASEYGLTFAPIFNDNGQFLYYQVKLDKQKQHVYFLPSTASSVLVEGDLGFVRDASALIVTFDPSMASTNLQAVDVARYDLSSLVQKPVISGITSESGLYALPMVDCANATVELPVLRFEESTNESIIVNGSCIRLLGNASGLLQVRDRFVYEYLDVYA